MKNFLCIILTAVLFFSLNFISKAEAAFPDKSITLYFDNSVENENDVVIRAIQRHWTKYCSQPLTIQYTEEISTEEAAKKELAKLNDGYSIGVINMPYSAMKLYKKGFTSFTSDSFEYVCEIMRLPYALTVLKRSPYNSAKELFRAARKAKRSIKIGCYEDYYANHFVIDNIIRKYPDVKFVPVYIKSSPSKVNIALFNGEIDVMLSTYKDLQNDAKQYKILGITSEKPSPAFPGKLTLKEQGIDIVIEFSRCFFTPKGVPQEYLLTLQNIYKKIFNDQAFQADLKRHHKVASYMDGAEYKKWITAEYKRIIDYLKRTENTK